MNVHPMQIISKNGVFNKIAFTATVTSEPKTFKTASQISEWQVAMKEEIDALHSQKTWSLVPLRPNKNLVGCKRIYKIKKNADGSMVRYKAILVVQRYSQEEGVDYLETFSPVVKPTTIRLIFSLAAQFKWSLRQLDVKNIFLHGILQKEVYMEQPPGFESATHPLNYVCTLQKSLYGLKQAPRAWNEKFTSFLSSLGFQVSQADHSLFVQQSSRRTVLLLLYIDDVILTSSSSQLINQVIQALTEEFEMKDFRHCISFWADQLYIRRLVCITDKVY
ncbi:hypothetical protein ACFXTI_012311 [Malus domestica]